jgi:hypothetical protein
MQSISKTKRQHPRNLDFTPWIYYGLICHLSTHVDGSPIFPILADSEVAQLVLTIPHSNAAEERVISVVRKNKTPFRL